MPIAALPQPTVQAIGSTSVISDPYSIVKELLDNALDASATSVGIEISQNTVDLIQVKDNGHGIPSSDHALVCRRTFTSKIQTVEDLRKIGGSSLGFRGEALASAAEVSGGLLVVTRVEAEKVGSSVKYGRNGELISTQRAAHPVGTTLRVTDLFKIIPVRRQTVLKSAAKTLSRIKKMVQAYAISHPAIRFSLRVLKAKNEINNWVYAPGPNTTLMEAALKVAGTDVASNCIERDWPSTDSDRTEISSTMEFRLVALLPNPSTDVAKINNGGLFFSIDGRPISSARGIGQSIAKLYKSYLRAGTGKENAPKITDPFLCLNIRCPEASYDVNIEPAKDDVLFEDSQAVLSLIEDLLRATYGQKDSNKQIVPTEDKDAIGNDNFDLLLAQRSPESTANSQSRDAASNSAAFVAASSLVPSPSHRDSPVNGDIELAGSESGTDVRRQRSSSREALNLWSLTKFNIPLSRTSANLQNDSHAQVRVYTGPGSVHKERNSRETSRRSSVGSFLPSPSASPGSSNSPTKSPSTPFRVPQMTPLARSQNDIRASRERDRERYGNGSLDTWFEKTTQVALSRRAETQSDSEQEPSLTQLAQGRFESESLSDTSDAGQGLPTQDSTSTTADISSESQPIPSSVQRHLGLEDKRRQEFPVLEQWSSRLQQSSSNRSELEDALDFERRKKEAIQKRREEIRGQGPKNSNSPHLSRYLAARAALNPASQEVEDQGLSIGTAAQSEVDNVSTHQVSKSILSPFDPRSYLMRRQSRGSKEDKARRINTNKLPFEIIPEGYDVHDIGLTWPADISLISLTSNQSSKTDIYTQSGCEFEAFTSSDPERPMKLWADRLSALVQQNYRTEESVSPAVQFDFSALPNVN